MTVSVLREMFAENNMILFKKFDQIDTEFARVHREISDLRDDVVEIIDNSIVPQLEEPRRDISLLKRAVTTA